MKRLFFALALCVFSLVAGRAGDVTDIGRVIGRGRTANPTLAIASFTGPAAAREQLTNDLLYSDWFKVVSGGKADFLLSAAYVEDGTNASLEMRLTDGNGQAWTDMNNQPVAFRQGGTVAQSTWLIHYAVDALIQRTYSTKDNQTPGFCASRLAYVKELNQVREVYLADFDGSAPTRLTNNGRRSVEPKWGPGNTNVLYTLYNTGSMNLVLTDLAAQSQRRLTVAKGQNSSGAISPDGRSIAYVSSKDGQVDLYVLDVASSTSRRLTNNSSVEASPCWSPDGRTICFVSDHASKNPTLYLMPASGGAPQPLLSVPTEAVAPSWSPVSGKICFSMRAGNYSIGMVEKPGPRQEAINLLNVGGDWSSPSWTADGRHIVCSRQMIDGSGHLTDGQALYLVDSYYKTSFALKKYAGNDTMPNASAHY